MLFRSMKERKENIETRMEKKTLLYSLFSSHKTIVSRY